MSRPLNDRQLSAMRRLSKGETYLSPDLAQQLAKRGLVVLTGKKHQRTEWQQPVKGSITWGVELTDSGRNFS